MKILIVGFTKIKFMPYMNFYLDNIDREKNDVHIIYWNRDLKEEDTCILSDCTLHEFRAFQIDDVQKISKIGNFLKYRRFVNNILDHNFYDFIIVLHSLPGVLLADKLKKHQNRFILDYRDSTYEGFVPFKAIVGKLVKWSSATFVSSDAFRRYLPESETIYTSHNILFDSLEHREDKEKYGIKSEKIRISFWGFIRHKDINVVLIDRLANDDRFELHYYGREQQVAFDLKQYAEGLHADNIFFHGEYKPKDRYEFIKNTDVIHNLYYDTNTLLAMGNKFYDGIIFKIPQVCMSGSFMGKICKENGVGISLNPYEESFPDQLEQYAKALDNNLFAKKCNLLLTHTLAEYNRGCDKIQALIFGNHEN